MEEKFKKGDVVQLRSGGPKMTVADVVNEGGNMIVSCRFFDKSNNLQVAEFDENEIAIYVSSLVGVSVHRV